MQMQKLENNLCHDSELVITKVCIQKSHTLKAMFESLVETCIDWMSFDFD